MPFVVPFGRDCSGDGLGKPSGARVSQVITVSLDTACDERGGGGSLTGSPEVRLPAVARRTG